MIYHETEHGVLYCGDCLEVMKQMPDESVDLAMCDFPYLLDAGGGKFNREREYMVALRNTLSKGFNDDILYALREKLNKMNGFFFCNKNQFKQYIDYAFDNKYYFDLLSWHKTNPSPLLNNNFLPDTEFIFYIRQRGVKLNLTYHTASRYFISNVEKNGYDHPAIKPISIIERLICNASVIGNVVIDPTSGSGTTAIACIRYDRRYILIEKEEKYCEIAARRIENELDQMRIEL